jgi:uncharacterized RDD family membrane protein YckC
VAIEFNCPHCGKLLTTSESRAFATAKCPACTELITVPAGSSAGGVPLPALEPTAAWVDSSTPAAAVATPVMTATAPPPSSAPVGSPRAVRSTIPCPQCASPIESWASYCSACGAPLVAAAPVVSFRYAGFWRRFVAVCIDFALITAAQSALKHLITNAGWQGDELWLLLAVLYYSAFESSPERATVGKMVMGISVCAADGRRLSFARAAIRTVAKAASVLVVVGLFMPLLTPRKQALHDILTNAVVVRN